MGCGQSKINLYPRKNKNGKGNNAKKSGEEINVLYDKFMRALADRPQSPQPQSGRGSSYV